MTSLVDAIDRVSLAAELAAVVGAEHVIADEAERRFFSQDVFTQGALCAAVVQPGSADEVAAVVAWAATREVDVLARGGGMSYTAGYLPRRSESVIIDLSRLNRIVEINETDMYVTVEAGCTWDALQRALAPRRVRTPYWGPLSGLKSTVGGALSQNSVFFGSGRHGTAADTVLGLTVVLADGSVVTTGSGGGVGANAFFRHYGPDLTGLFTGDAGAFGIKTHVTLRLIRRQQGTGYASFSFEHRDGLVAAMTAIAQEGLATECFAFDPYLQSVRMKRASLMSDAKTLAAVVTKQGSVFKGVKEGARMALAGRRFAAEVKWPLHVAVEERNERAAADALDQVRRIAASHGGTETENTVPKAVHALPFGPLNGMIGNQGERWVPVHGVLPHSRVADFFRRLDQFYAQHREEMDLRSVSSGYLLMTIQGGATLIEPVFYWRDERMTIHDRTVDSGFLAKVQRHQPDEATRAFVSTLRGEIINLFASAGATHFQVGKTYPLHATRKPSEARLLASLKARLDPSARLNPGALGVAEPEG
jgi:FAD/FMN-containing dehydrogenase